MFELSQEHESFRKVVRDFAEREIAPHVAQWDRDHHFPVETVHAMGELGLFGMTWNVNWCVAGLDRELSYAPNCKMARP